MVAAELKYLAAEQAGGGGGFERVDKVTGGLGKRAWEHLTFLLAKKNSFFYTTLVSVYILLL